MTKTQMYFAICSWIFFHLNSPLVYWVHVVSARCTVVVVFIYQCFFLCLILLHLCIVWFLDFELSLVSTTSDVSILTLSINICLNLKKSRVCPIPFQVDLYTVSKNVAKCLTTSSRVHRKSLPVVLENYGIEGIFLQVRLCWYWWSC